MSPLAPSVSHRDPKGRKFMSIIEAAYDKAGLSDAEAQRVNETSGLGDLIARFIATHRVRDDFASEEVVPIYDFPRYRQLTLLEQANRLKKLFPELRGAFFDEKLDNTPPPKGAEGPFILFDWRLLADNYIDACKKVFAKVRELYCGNAVNSFDRLGKFTEKHLRESATKQTAMEQIREAQKGYDFLVVAGQFGLQHRGRSVRRARVVMQNSGQFGFGLFETLILLLTHTDRLRHSDDLGIDCAGDEISWDGDGQFTSVLCVVFDDGMLAVYSYWLGRSSRYYGSVSGFSPLS